LDVKEFIRTCEERGFSIQISGSQRIPTHVFLSKESITEDTLGKVEGEDLVYSLGEINRMKEEDLVESLTKLNIYFTFFFDNV
jgi:hypothetical protein